MKFKEWLMKEVGTSTSSIAGFSRIAIPLVTRMWPHPVMQQVNDDPPKKKKIKKQPQVEEAFLSEGREVGHSWLDRRGNFVPLNGKSHGDYAQNIGKTIDQMWAEGWMRVIFANNMLYAHNEKIAPNSKQIAALKNAAIENNFTHVVYDSGNDEKVIWSEYDQM